MSDCMGVVIGRFQVDRPTEGHRALLDYVAARHQHMLVLVGYSGLPLTPEDPLPPHIRTAMIQELHPQAVVWPLWDFPTNREWSIRIDRRIEWGSRWFFDGITEAVLYGGRESSLPFYRGRHSTKTLDNSDLGVDVDTESGTARRRELSIRWENDPVFRAGMIHAVSLLRSVR